jgi:hypothetical protein
MPRNLSEILRSLIRLQDAVHWTLQTEFNSVAQIVIYGSFVLLEGYLLDVHITLKIYKIREWEQ